MPEALLFWGGLALFVSGAAIRVVSAVAGLATRMTRPAAPNAHALRVLAERYAAGEIDRDEYFEKRAMLELR